jgi:hypothetical protein
MFREQASRQGGADMTETLRSMIAAARGTVTEVPPAEIYEAQQSDDVHLIIDVCEPHEFDDAHVRTR